MAGVIFVGHGHDGEDAYGDVYDYVHHSPLRLGASIRRGKAPLSADFGDVTALVTGLWRAKTPACRDHRRSRKWVSKRPPMKSG